MREAARVVGRMRCTLLLARFCCRVACIHKHPITSWVRWRPCTICPHQAGPTGRWPMPKWRRICWRRCSMI
jgi:hypothetical protein